MSFIYFQRGAMKKDFLAIADYTPEEIQNILAVTLYLFHLMK
jgi:hypothetical protein